MPARPARAALVALVLLAPRLAAPARAQGSAAVVPTGQVFHVPLDDVSVTDPGGARVRLNGAARLEASEVAVCLGLEPGQPTSCPGTAVFTYRLESSLALDLVAEAGGTIDVELPLGKLAVATLDFGPGASVGGTVFLQGKLVVRGQVAPGLRAGLFDALDVRGQVRLGQLPVAGHRPPQVVDFQLAPPEVPGASALELDVCFEGGVSVAVGLAGLPPGEPFLRARTGLRLDADPLGDPWWEARGLVEASAGWGHDLVGGLALAVAPTALVADALDAGGPLSGWQPEPARWSRAYDVDASEELTAVHPLADGFVVVGNTAGVGSRGWVARLAADGAVLWEQRGNGAGGTALRPKAVHVDGQGEIVVAGTLANGGARLSRYALDGEPLSGEVFGDAAGGALTLRAATPTADGGLAWCGSVQRVISQAPGVTVQPVVVRMDAAGSVLWARELVLEQGASFGAGLGLAEGADGELLVAGEVYFSASVPGQPGLASKNSLLFVLDGQGALVHARALGSLGYESALAVAQLHDGSALVVGNVAQEPRAAWAARVGPLGDLAWSRTYTTEGALAAGLTGSEAFTAAAAAPGGALLAGTVGLAAARDAWVLRLAGDGDVLWHKRLHGPDQDDLAGVRPLAGGLVAWGRTRSLDPQGLAGGPDEQWLARAAPEGQLSFDPVLGFDTGSEAPIGAPTQSTACVPLPSHVQAITIDSFPSALAPMATQAVVTLLTL